MKVMKKSGMSYVTPCILTIILCMILAAVIIFANAVHIIRQTERNSRVVLDNYVITDAIVIYDSIKKGNDSNAFIDPASYTSALAEFCTFEKSGSFLYHKDANGNEDFRISVPQLGYTTDKRLKLYTSYTVYVPIYFFGVKITTAQVPITVESKYLEKF